MEISHYPFYVAMISITCTIASSKNDDLFILSRFKYGGDVLEIAVYRMIFAG
jgi:hypothetical protein